MKGLAITVDLEFFDSPFLFRDMEPPGGVETIGVEGVEFVADLLESHGCRGTFFVIGEVAESHPDLVSELSQRGHEIASHGHSRSHPDLREMTPAAVREEIEPTKRLLEELTGEEVTGYRAPTFAVDSTVVSVLKDTGFVYDSSVVPCRKIPGFYGFPQAPSTPFDTGRVFTAGGLTELPVTVSPLLKLPLSGAWMRLFGRRYALRGIGAAMRARGTAMVYVHPWELVDLPRYPELPRRLYWRTGNYTRETLRSIVDKYSNEIVTAESLSGNRDGGVSE